MGQGITPGAEPSSKEQKELEEFGEDGVGHLRALSPRCQMVMMNLTLAFRCEYICIYLVIDTSP